MASWNHQIVFRIAILLLSLFESSVLAREIGTLNPDDDGKLIFSTLLWRHGDRSPESFAPNDPYKNRSNWEFGPGQLTTLGKQQHFKLGKWLRERYNQDDFLPIAYSENDIYVRSTDVDRTLASAYANLAGLYPPSGVQIWNKYLLWQPIPVHTVPATSDNLLGSILNCSKFDRLSAEVMTLPEVTSLVKENLDLINYIAVNTEMPAQSSTFEKLVNALMMRDTFFVEETNKKTLPAWTNAIYPSKKLDELTLLFYVLSAYTNDLAKFRVGYFFKEVLERSRAKANGTLNPDRKLWVYSAHDVNIATLLKALGMWDNKFVTYASVLLLELRKKIDNQVYLNIAYRRGPDGSDEENLTNLDIPGCGRQCKLEDVFEIYKDILPTQDFVTACKL